MRFLISIICCLGLFAEVSNAEAEPDTRSVFDKTAVADHIIVVVDASGSMAENLGGRTRMAAARDALKKVIALQPEDVRIGILVFPSAGWVYPLGSRNLKEINAAIDGIHDGGGTPLGSNIKAGADALLSAKATNHNYGTYRLLIVTDGEAQDGDLVDTYTPDVIGRGITVDVIGVGMSGDHTLATKVHSYRRANDPEALDRAVREVFAEVTTASTDSADGDAFDLISAFSEESAEAAIGALSSTGNHPIGEKVSVPPPATTTPEPKSTGCACQTSGSGGGVFILCVFVGVLLMRRRKTGRS